MPNFKKSRGFKMKGYSYPGKSPMKLKEGDPSTGDQKQYQDQPEDKITSEDIPNEQTGPKGKKKEKKGKIDWSSVATDAISAVVQTGAQAGIEALIRPRTRPSRSAGASGSMGNVNFGTSTNLLNNKKS